MSFSSSRLFPQFSPDCCSIVSFLLDHWNIQFDAEKPLKSSQNQTFQGKSVANPDELYAIRLSPVDHLARMESEARYIDYLVSHGVHACAFIRPLSRPINATADQQFAFAVSNTAVLISQWAPGQAPQFTTFNWLKQSIFPFEQGKFLGKIHQLAWKYINQQSTDSKRLLINLPSFRDIHDGIMKSVSLHPDDEREWTECQQTRQQLSSSTEPDSHSSSPPSVHRFHSSFAILHGDLNISNFHWKFSQPSNPSESDAISAGEEEIKSGRDIDLWVFDWDQMQFDFIEWDLAQCTLTGKMLLEGGNLPSGDPINEINWKDYDAFIESLVNGYESVCGPGSINRPRLLRMIELRKRFYYEFCHRAAVEGSIPVHMKWFIDYINEKWMKRAPPSDIFQ